ncbi:MAG: Gfo/Idh/MocA family oxidoreductase [Clostridia bacterium]|nr:Gfo/Idh/MocA family oxidoreductase [Clostridia bacterium]
MTEKVWKVAVVGCGSFANGQYFPNISKEANAVCVAAVDVVFERAEAACRRYGVPAAYHDVYELIASCDFDVAIDAASIQAHHEINMAILSAGKHLISQKPAAPDVERLTLQIETAKAKKVNFVCAPIHPMRYDLSVARQLMASGAIGTPYYAKCNMSHGGPEYFQYRDADPSWFFEPGAGALVDMGVHGLQIVTTLFGPAKRVGCMAKVTTPRRTVRSGAFDGKEIDAAKIPDQYVITLDFGEGKMALVDSGFSEKASKAPQLEIFGDRGTISFTKPYMQNPEPEVYLDSPERGIRGWIEIMPGANPPKKLLSQCCCLRDLIESIETGRPPVLSPEHARHVLEIMCAIPAASEEGRLVELHTTFERPY